RQVLRYNRHAGQTLDRPGCDSGIDRPPLSQGGGRNVSGIQRRYAFRATVANSAVGWRAGSRGPSGDRDVALATAVFLGGRSARPAGGPAADAGGAEAGGGAPCAGRSTDVAAH